MSRTVEEYREIGLRTWEMIAPTWAAQRESVERSVDDIRAWLVRELGASAGDYPGAWLRPLLASAVPIAIWVMIGEPAADWYAIGSAVVVGLVPYAVVVAAVEAPRPAGRARLRLAANPPARQAP